MEKSKLKIKNRKLNIEERKLEMEQGLKVEAIDRKPFGSDLNDTSTETGFFTVSPLIPKKAY
jgi:hypothetical protein